ncbi:MAG: hypothetical protein JJLCMIEE_00586 [Acidimicrobiales bacterium]|nr:MAG: RDD family protein [Actinomycetota bacterium]MBV6507537.1 hypothetical protein [Acidimicrobiales bacterium]RIK07479.1 MAG: hypothetical protein DCC48_02955 [Acidobacteriota bacterium]
MNDVTPGDATSGWKPDPFGRFEMRYWNGTAWTEDVSNAGRQTKDPAGAEPGGLGQPQPGGAIPYQPGVGIQGPIGEGWIPELNLAAAGPWLRIGARAIDFLILAVIGGIIIAIFAAFAFDIDSANPFAFGGGFFVMILVIGLIGVAYEVGFVAARGQTPGKMAVGAKIVKLTDGQIPDTTTAFMRWLPQAVNWVPFIGGLLGLALLIANLVLLFTDPRRQDVYDKAAKTVVIMAR